MAMSFDPQLHINPTHSHHWRQIRIIPFWYVTADGTNSSCLCESTSFRN